MENCVLHSCDAGQGLMAGYCELDNEPSGSIKRRKSFCCTEFVT